jgi:hypothetical protein
VSTNNKAGQPRGDENLGSSNLAKEMALDTTFNLEASACFQRHGRYDSMTQDYDGMSKIQLENRLALLHERQHLVVKRGGVSLEQLLLREQAPSEPKFDGRHSLKQILGRSEHQQARKEEVEWALHQCADNLPIGAHVVDQFWLEL